MPTKTIPLTAISIQSTKPTTRFGQLAAVPLHESPTGQMLVRAALNGIPAGAVVTSALVVLQSRNQPNWSGARTILARALTGPFSTATTYGNRPGNTATNEASVAKTSAVFGTIWQLNITAIAQAWISGTLANNGLVIFTASTVPGIFQGATAPWGPPALVIEYQLTPVAPTGLNPASGAVSKSKPTLQFQTPSDTSAIQVQIDAAADAVSPDFDSGEVASSAGLLDLATTAYPGLSAGATTKWRARAKNGLGWSAWSPWATFNRVTWGAYTFTSPGGTSEDPSPTIQGTYAGTITAWRALTRGPTGALVDDSGWTPGSTVSFGTTKSVGASGTAVVQLRDNVVRDATPGDPDYLETTQAFTVTPSGTPTAPVLSAATSDGISAEVVLTGTRGTIPDELVIYRNNVLVDRVTGASVFTGTAFTYRDRTAPMNTPATYKVWAVAAGAWSNASTTKTVTPRCQGIWVYDTESTQAALILGDEDLEQTQPEVAIVHTPVSGPGEIPQVVRRRLGRFPRQGVLSGVLVDALGIAAADSEVALRAWAENDAGHIYRLVLGNQNDPVILGDITFEEVSENDDQQRVLAVSGNWWYQAVR